MKNLIYVTSCVVDADNIFKIWGLEYEISPSVKEYRVFNSYKENNENFTNESPMSIVHVFIERESNRLRFFNEHEKEITKLMLVEEV